MDKVRIGVIGLGWVAQVVHLPILSRLEDADNGHRDTVATPW